MTPQHPLNDPRLRQEPLAPPDGYFDALEARVMQSVAHAPRPTPMPLQARQFPFAVPAGYFEALPQRIMARLSRRVGWAERALERLEWVMPRRVLQLAPALASLAVLVMVGYWVLRPARPLLPPALTSEQAYLEAVAAELSGTADEAILIEAAEQWGQTQGGSAEDIDANALEQYLMEGDLAPGDLSSELIDRAYDGQP